MELPAAGGPEELGAALQAELQDRIRHRKRSQSVSSRAGPEEPAWPSTIRLAASSNDTVFHGQDTEARREERSRTKSESRARAAEDGAEVARGARRPLEVDAREFRVLQEQMQREQAGAREPTVTFPSLASPPTRREARREVQDEEKVGREVVVRETKVGREAVVEGRTTREMVAGEGRVGREVVVGDGRSREVVLGEGRVVREVLGENGGGRVGREVLGENGGGRVGREVLVENGGGRVGREVVVGEVWPEKEVVGRCSKDGGEGRLGVESIEVRGWWRVWCGAGVVVWIWCNVV